MAVTEALSLLFAWWAALLGRAAGLGGSGNSLAMNQFNPLAFVTHGITPLGYAAFTFTLAADGLAGQPGAWIRSERRRRRGRASRQHRRPHRLARQRRAAAGPDPPSRTA